MLYMHFQSLVVGLMDNGCNTSTMHFPMHCSTDMDSQLRKICNVLVNPYIL